MDANPGLESRFARTIQFPDYTTDELVKIFESMGEKNQYHLDADARAALGVVIERGTARPRLRQRPFRPQRLRVGRGHHALRLTDIENPTAISSQPSRPPTSLPSDPPASWSSPGLSPGIARAGAATAN